MAEFKPGDRVKVVKPGAKTFGKPGTVKTNASYDVLLDGEAKTRVYAESSLDPATPPPVVDPPPSYYVSTTGSNGAAGTLTAPWKTLQYALNTAPAGATVAVAAGSYAAFTYTHANVGNPIRLSGQGDVVIADPCVIKGGQGVIFENLRFEGGTYLRAGDSLEPYANLTFRRCYSSGAVSNPTGISVGYALGRGGKNILWDRCEHRGGVYAVHMSVGSSAPPRTTGLRFIDCDFRDVDAQTMLIANCDDVEINGGTIGWSLDPSGVADKYHNDAIIIAGACGDIRLRRVRFHQEAKAHARQGQVIFSQPALGPIDGPILAENCELSHQDPGTAALWQLAGAHHQVDIVNCTFAADGTPGRGLLLGGFTGNLNLHNNIIPSFDESSTPAASRSHNLIGADPLFVDVAAGNYRLQAGSPAKKAGSPIYAPATDLEGTPRGVTPSMGCYQ